MIQKFWQERVQLLMLMMNGVASVGIAIAIATAMSTAHATAARLASMAAVGKVEAGADSSAAVPANVQAGNAAGRGDSGKAEGAERCDPGEAGATKPMSQKGTVSSPGASGKAARTAM